MKFIITIITLCFFNISHSQIELIKKNKTYSIGEVRSEFFGNIQLGYTEKDNQNLYYLLVNRKSDNFCKEKYYRIEFYGKQKDLNYLYSLILDTFKQDSEAKTEVLIGKSKVVISTDVFMEDISSRSQTKNLYKLFTLDNCRLFQLTKEELRTLFNK